MFYTLNVHNVTCQLYLDKAGKNQLSFTHLIWKSIKETSTKIGIKSACRGELSHPTTHNWLPQIRRDPALHLQQKDVFYPTALGHNPANEKPLYIWIPSFLQWTLCNSPSQAHKSIPFLCFSGFACGFPLDYIPWIAIYFLLLNNPISAEELSGCLVV